MKTETRRSLIFLATIALIGLIAFLVDTSKVRGFGEGPFMPVSIWPRDAYCKTVSINLQGTANADVAVDGTAGGLVVATASTTRCGMAIANSGGADMRCASGSLAPTSTECVIKVIL